MMPPMINDLRALAELTAHGVELDMERVLLSPRVPLDRGTGVTRSRSAVWAPKPLCCMPMGASRVLWVSLQARPRKNRPEAGHYLYRPVAGA